MSIQQLTLEQAIAWLDDRLGKTVNLRLVVDGRGRAEASGQLRDIGNSTYQVGGDAIDLSTPLGYTFELRYDEPDSDSSPR